MGVGGLWPPWLHFRKVFPLLTNLSRVFWQDLINLTCLAYMYVSIVSPRLSRPVLAVQLEC